MDWQQAQKELITKLIPLYGDRESTLIADWVMENLSGWKRIDRLLHRTEPLSPTSLQSYHQYTRELLEHRPVQYVLHESWFAGMQLYVDENVLIPRPETEELVEWITTTPFSTPPSILDVGTGSGCIALALAKNLPHAAVHACDISPKALRVARRNATTQHLSLTLHELDFLDPKCWDTLPAIDCLVSNPPYIPKNEKAEMSTHVIDYEPNQALFVPDNDPLLFYDALSRFAKTHLSPGGSLFAEIHESFGLAAVQLFKKAGFQEVLLRKDMQGKDRMIRAR